MKQAKDASHKRRSPVGVIQHIDDGKDISPIAETGFDRLVSAIQGSKALEGRDKIHQSTAEARKTVHQLFRQKTDAVDPRRHSSHAGGVDGPNLVTHLPDIVVQSDHRRPLPFRVAKQAVVLFLDISGFTALCEKYSQAAKTGTEQLTKTLNGYMSALVSEIISYDGDILKFAGDAILSMWPVESLFLMNIAVENVITCALDIQRKHGTYTTNDGVTLKVKIGIAVGEVEILIIGNDDERTYIEVGRGIEDVNKAENMCEKGGDVIVAPSAWIHCHKLTTTHSQMHDTKFIKVTHIYPHSSVKYRTERTIPVTKDMENLDRSIRNLIIPSKMVLNQASSNVMESRNSDSSNEIHVEDDNLGLTMGGYMRRLRKTIITHFSREKVHHLKLFISKPVLRKIEDGQPLEYLSEMRQVTMLFINLDVDRSTKYGYLLLMQRCHEVIFAKAKRMRGCISKIFAFDKGCTFMVIFGLPGYKHENDSAHALGCAYEIYTELNQIVGLIQTSIGVTTGPTYCGIVGHNHRHEYTVIGRRVNMGARLMMHYRGKVICDNTTFYYSKLNETYFIVQETKEMKGLQQVGTVREYRPLVNLKDTVDQVRVQQEQKPIIGRDVELAKFENCLDRLFYSKSERTPVVMILGEIGMGRTRVMNAFLAASLRRSVTVILCALSIGNVNFSYYVVRTLLLQLTKCDKASKEVRMKLLTDTFSQNKPLMKNINLLDALLDADTEYDGKKEVTSVEVMKEIVRLVVKHYAERHTALIFAVDDTHLMDDYSWKCMSIFAENDNTMLVMTKRVLLDQNIRNENAVALLLNSKNLVVHCSSLSDFHMASIACQFLNVARIPDSLDHVLRLNSMGIPSWIDLLLREYLYEAVIKIEPTMIVNHTETMVVPAPKDLMEKDTHHEQVGGEIVDNLSSNFVDELKLDSMSPNAELVCFMLIQQTDDLKVPTSIASMIQARIDHMQEVDQTVLKSASIIGHFVFREILQHMLQVEMSKVDLGESIQRLADSGAFACASSMKTSRGRAGVAGMGGAFTGQTCICHGVNDERAMRDCRVLMFLSASLRLTAYEMMLEQNRRPLHMSAAHFLEEKIRRLSAKTMNENSLYDSYMYGEEDEQQAESDLTQILPPQEVMESPKEPSTEEEPKNEKRKRSRMSSGYKFNRGSKRISATPKEAPHATRLKTIIGADLGGDSDPGSLVVSEFIKKHLQATKRRSLTRSFQQTDTAALAADLAKMSDSAVVNYTGFERLGVLRIQYPQIAEQYRGAGNTQNTVFYFIEAAAACLSLFDYHGAITYLREASRIFRDLKNGRNPFEGRVATLDNWKPEPYDEGNMESLIGQTLFSMEKPKKAVPHFQRALKLFGCEQVSSSFRKNLATALEYSKYGKHHEKASNSEAQILSSQSICLFYLFEDCIARDDLVGARYTAVQQLTKTERAGDLLGQIEAATCMLKLAHLTKDAHGVLEYENKAKIKCIVAMQNIRNDQVIRLTRTYWAAFEVHVARDSMNEAVESGLAASRMMTAIRGSGITHVHMLASLVNALMFADRVKDAVDVLDVMSSDSGRGESRCWYYYCCIQMVLTLGVRLALMEDCLAYTDEILSQRLFTKQPLLLFCLACSLCLYYKRIRAEDRFEEWRKVAAKNEPMRYDSFITVIAFFDLLECKLLQLSRVIGEIRRAVAIQQQGARRSLGRIYLADKRYLVRTIKKDFTFGSHVVEHLVGLQPRFLILQAYDNAIVDRDKGTRQMIRKCIKQATALNVVSHMRWAKHNQEVWYRETSSNSEKGVGESDEEAEVPVKRTSLTSSTGRRRSTIYHRKSMSAFDRRSSFLEPSMAGRSRLQSTQTGPSALLRERGPSTHYKSFSAAISAGADPSELHDQWLRGADTSFPFWMILNHVRNETRMLLFFSLPLPHWFAARMF